MWKLILSAASSKLLGKFFAVGAGLLAVQMLPLFLGWLPGFDFSDGWSFNVLNPLENALSFAPPGVRYMIHYFYIDLAVTLYVSGLVYGLAKDIFVSGK